MYLKNANLTEKVEHYNVNFCYYYKIVQRSLSLGDNETKKKKSSFNLDDLYDLQDSTQ